MTEPRRWHVWVSDDGKRLSSTGFDEEFNPELITVTEGYYEGDTVSTQGLQKAGNTLNILGNLLPVMGEADATGVQVGSFVTGVLRRMGVPPDKEIDTIVTALANIVSAASPPTEPPA